MAEGNDLAELKRLRRKCSFVVIGDAAFNLYTGKRVEKNEIILKRWKDLGFFREKIRAGKVFIVKWDGGEAIAHLPYTSSLRIPPEEVIRMSTKFRGFLVPIPEVLALIELGRRDFSDIAKLGETAGFREEIVKRVAEDYGLFEERQVLFNLLE